MTADEAWEKWQVKYSIQLVTYGPKSAERMKTAFYAGYEYGEIEGIAEGSALILNAAKVHVDEMKSD